MTDPDWSSRIEHALRSQADSAPRAEELGWDLASTARRRVRQRRQRLVTAAAAVVAVVAIGGISVAAGQFLPTSGNDSDSAGSGEAAHAPVQTDARVRDTRSGWRWESYGGVEVSVPAGWGYGITHDPWCTKPAGQPKGEVGRPGPIGYVGCKPVIPLDKLGEHVWFSDIDPADPKNEPATVALGKGWSRDVRFFGAVRLEVQTSNQGLRQQILDSIRQVTVDANGCPVEHPITTTMPRYDVPAGQGLSWDTPVTGLSACRYQRNVTPPLVGSLRFDGQRATEILTAIRSQPGSNPVLKRPQCMADDDAPTEAIVLRFDTVAGIREIWVGYDSCRTAGFHNGTGTRGLFPEPLRLFATGPLRPTSGAITLPGW